MKRRILVVVLVRVLATLVTGGFPANGDQICKWIAGRYVCVNCPLANCQPVCDQIGCD